MNGLLLLLAVLFLFTGIKLGNAQQKVAERIWEIARAEGSVLVIIELDVPWKPHEGLNSPEVRQQKRDITAAQDQLLAELAGTNYKLIDRFDNTPGMGLQVDLSVLPLIEKSKVVKSVTENRKNYPSVPGRK